MCKKAKVTVKRAAEIYHISPKKLCDYAGIKEEDL